MLLEQYRAAQDLEVSLGDPLDPRRTFSFAGAVSADERDEYPEAACAAINEWGYSRYYVPVAHGGSLQSFEELVSLIRVVSRRDLTAAIGHGQTFLGSIAIWVGGSEEQRCQQAARVLGDRQAALALTERAHGGDLLSNEVRATPIEGGGFRLSGEKWLINNATRGEALTVFARTSEAGGPRGFSLFLVAKPKLSADGYQHLPRERTHGIRGADISGIRFGDCSLPAEALVGRLGSGLELTLGALQITRTLCAPLSLGAADTALRATLAFARNRRLYGDTVQSLPHARRQLVDAFLDLLICDCLTLCASRALQVSTDQASVTSAVTKYFVPTTLERTIQRLAVVLGARHFLRDGHWAGIFQKMLRDSGVVGLFDGSTVVNLEALGLQLPHLAAQRARRAGTTDEPLGSRLEILAGLDRTLPSFDPAQLSLFSRGRDDLIDGLNIAAMRLSEINEPLPAPLVAQVHALQEALGKLDAEVMASSSEHGVGFRRVPELFDFAERYCTLAAAAACLHIWLQNRARFGGTFAEGAWLVHCLDRLLRQVHPGTQPVQNSAELDPSVVFDQLTALFDANQTFSVVPLQLAGGAVS